MNSSIENNILIVAGEASSSAYALRLLKIWKEQGKSFHAFGVGDRQMEAEGFECIGRSEDIAVVGISEVLKSISKIKSAFNGIVKKAGEVKPRFALLLDLPDFNLRLAKKLKRLGIPVVYYISPQVWAWRTGRIKTIKKYVDHMLVILPFEEKFYEQHGVPVTFVGHPLLDEVKPELFDESRRRDERARYGIRPEHVVLGLMPGSRRGELEHHLPVQIQVADVLKKDFPNLKVMILVAPTLDIERVRSSLGQTTTSFIVLKKDPFEMISLPDVILAASGTATLMVALMKTPMVIMYIVSKTTAWIGRKLIKAPKFFGLSNIILDRMQSQEFLQEEATVERLSEALRPLIQNPELRKQHQAGQSEIYRKLGDHGASQRVAEFLERYWV